MTPWWSRPTSEGGADANPGTPHNPGDPQDTALPSGPVSAASPLSESRFFENETETEAYPETGYPVAEPQPEVSPEVRGDEPWRAAEPAPAIDRPAVDPFSLPYEDDPEGLDEEQNPDAAAAAHGSSLAELAEGDEGDDEGEDEEGETEGEPIAGEGAERTGRKRGRRGGRRRRGRGNQAENGDAEPAPAIAAVPVPRPAERHERTERPERVERIAAMERPQRQERHERHEVTELPPVDLESLTRQIYMSMPERSQSVADERKIALFCDLENVALGVRDSEIKKFDINLVLERLLEKGKIIVKRAYCDWERYSDYKRTFHEAAVELIDIPQKHYSGKNSADIKMVVDAMDLSYSKEHLDTFVLLSGDSDFSPLVSKLKENNKYVIGIGVKNSSSALLVDNCDEFIYYEDVWRDQHSGPQLEGLTKKQTEVFGIMIDSIQALKRENKDVLWGSMIKQTMKRKKPSFNEGYYGYSTFSELLEDAERRGVVKLKKDQRSGSYIVTGFSSRA